ncbi:MAG TPA: DJ-1/PfpI family protein [Parvibaculum sp.]
MTKADLPTLRPTLRPTLARRVMMLGYNGAQVLDIAGPAQVFVHARGADGKPAYAAEIVGRTPGPMLTTGGISLLPDRILDDIGEADLEGLDTFIVSGGIGSRALAQDAEVLDFIRRASGQARRTVSICTGALLLAAAGLLDGRRAATHWAFAAQLKRDYPRVEVDDDAIYIRDGNIWTSAGVTAGMDLALALVEDDLGREQALLIARHLVMFLMRPGGQSQFSAQLAAQAVDDERIAPICAHIVENPREPLTVPALAERAHMSERTFARRFAAATGTTPALFVERARLDDARRRLSDSAAPIEAIAQDAGFGGGERMRRAFLRHLGVTPNRYRERFQTARRPHLIATGEHQHVS